MRLPVRPAPAALALAVAGLVLATVPAHAQSAGDLAKKLSNPVASLISVPFQLNYHTG
jgi:hypothetical protein